MFTRISAKINSTNQNKNLQIHTNIIQQKHIEKESHITKAQYNIYTHNAIQHHEDQKHLSIWVYKKS